MAVLVKLSETLDGTQIADALDGGGNGIDFGQVVNAEYAPIVDKTANTGAKRIYISHDAVDDPITNVSQYVQAYGTTTGFTYGGRSGGSPVADYNALIALGDVAAESSKNNATGNEGGLWVEQKHDVAVANQFDIAARPTEVFAFKTGQGEVVGTSILVGAAAMVIDSDQSQGGNATGFTPTAPVAGTIGKNNDTALGDNAKLGYRVYLNTGFANGGVYQFELVTTYRATS